MATFSLRLTAEQIAADLRDDTEEFAELIAAIADEVHTFGPYSRKELQDWLLRWASADRLQTLADLLAAAAAAEAAAAEARVR